MSEKEIALHYIQKLNTELLYMVDNLCFGDDDYSRVSTIVLNLLVTLNK